MRYLTKQEIDNMRQFRAKGISVIKIAEIFNVCLDSVYYHTSEGVKQRVRNYGKRWREKNLERAKASHLRWQNANHRITYPSMCLSLMKQSLRNGWITEDRILQTIE